MLKECALCGFSDKQDDMIRNETTMEWEHQECLNDYWQGEARRKEVAEMDDSSDEDAYRRDQEAWQHDSRLVPVADR